LPPAWEWHISPFGLLFYCSSVPRGRASRGTLACKREMFGINLLFVDRMLWTISVSGFGGNNNGFPSSYGVEGDVSALFGFCNEIARLKTMQPNARLAHALTKDKQNYIFHAHHCVGCFFDALPEQNIVLFRRPLSSLTAITCLS
jgi:hypothetical protein